MGRIKDLRQKVKDGEATEEEIVELEELETEAKDEEEVDEKEDEKSMDSKIKEAAAKFMNIISGSVSEAKDSKKANLYESKEQEIVKDLTPAQKTGEFIKSLINGAREKLQVLSEGTAADGGYLVPEEWANQIIEKRDDVTIIRPRATTIQMTTDTLHLPQLATKPHVYWTAEKSVKSTSTATFDEITFTPYTLAVIIVLTKQLVADASVGLPSGIINYVTNLVVRAIATEEDRVFLTGAGTTQPTGLSAYTFGATVSAANALTGDHIISAYYKLGMAYRADAVWIMNSRVIANIKGLKDTTNRYLFSDALTAGGYPTLLGRPVLESNQIGSSTIYLGDLKAYYIAQREGISMMQSEEATVGGYSMFERNEVAVRVEERLDGELTDVNAFVSITSTGVS